ncbi:hypothetical protein, partial [Rhodopirellula islandica]|uniref:hypothetical protein n=1 Tax=Rhodopirellula islandica TaxID=595434 RepID=UPI000649582C
TRISLNARSDLSPNFVGGEVTGKKLSTKTLHKTKLVAVQANAKTAHMVVLDRSWRAALSGRQ